jgi:hypothetical protein
MMRGSVRYLTCFFLLLPAPTYAHDHSQWVISNGFYDTATNAITIKGKNFGDSATVLFNLLQVNTQTVSDCNPSADTGLARFAGEYHGEYIGTERGVFGMKIEVDGTVKATFLSPTIGMFLLNGTITREGRMRVTVELGGVRVFAEGRMADRGGRIEGSGKWESDSGYRGTWSASPGPMEFSGIRGLPSNPEALWAVVALMRSQGKISTLPPGITGGPANGSARGQGRTPPTEHSFHLLSLSLGSEPSEVEDVYLILDERLRRLGNSLGIFQPVFVVSPDAKSVLVSDGVFNGVLIGEEGDKAVQWKGAPMFSPKGLLTASVGDFERVGSPAFDGDQLTGFCGLRDKTWRAVVNGKVAGAASQLPCEVAASGRNVAFTEQSASGWRVVVDGQAGPAYEAVAGLSLAPDTAEPTYGARTGKEWQLVIKGKPQAGSLPPVIRTATASGGEVGIVVREGSGVVCRIYGGKSGRGYDEIGALSLSPDGTRLAYAARKGKNWLVVIADRDKHKEGHAYYRVGAGSFDAPGREKIRFGAVRYGAGARAPLNEVVPDNSTYRARNADPWAGDGGLTGGGGPAWLDNRRLVYVAWEKHRVFAVQETVP